MEAESLQHEIGEIMHENHAEGITQEPRKPQLVDMWFFCLIELHASWHDSDDGRSAKGHEGSGTSVHTERAHEQVKDQPDAETWK